MSVRMFSNGVSVVLVETGDAIVFVGPEEEAKEWAARKGMKIHDYRISACSGYGY